MSDSFFKEEPDPKKRTEIPSLDSSSGEEQSWDSSSEAFSSEDGRMAAIMAYIPILCFVPLLNMRDNPQARFHARQGVLLFLIELVALLFLVDGISDFVFKAILIAAVALSLVGIYFALQGKSFKLPIIGDLADKAKL